MEYLLTFIDIFLHLDQHLNEIIINYGYWTYAILFMIVFLETGIVVTPFLPGDSLLFATGAFASQGSLSITYTIFLLLLAAILGDAANYYIGKKFGQKLIGTRFIKKEYIDRTHSFYERYGGKTIIIARFVPIIRTFAPFLAGVGTMSYRKFFSYNVVGAVLWVFSLCLAGYYFGAMPIVKENFGLVVVAIIVISILPAVIEYLKIRSEKKQNAG
jgi:membrane-associated protein